MSGILNSKQRVLDTIVTSQGRKQMVTGKFNIKFVTFSDASTFYQADAISGSADASTRIYLESCALPQDQVTFEADDSGRLVPMPNMSGFDVLGGQILSGSDDGQVFLTGSDFASTSETLIGSTVENFQNIYTIGTLDEIFDENDFLISNGAIRFQIDDTKPISDPSLQTVNINHLESLFQDKRLSNIPNFRYLPPLNRVPSSVTSLTDPDVVNVYKLGFFQPLGPTHTLTWDEIAADLATARQAGCSKTIRFEPTNNANRLACQFFEVHVSELLKLDVIDFGIFKTGNQNTPTRHVFFAGKVFLDDFGTHTFFRLFTLVFE